jgi:hypothetical protein
MLRRRLPPAIAGKMPARSTHLGLDGYLVRALMQLGTILARCLETHLLAIPQQSEQTLMRRVQAIVMPIPTLSSSL